MNWQSRSPCTTDPWSRNSSSPAPWRKVHAGHADALWKDTSPLLSWWHPGLRKVRWMAHPITRQNISAPANLPWSCHHDGRSCGQKSCHWERAKAMNSLAICSSPSASSTNGLFAHPCTIGSGRLFGFSIFWMSRKTPLWFTNASLPMSIGSSSSRSVFGTKTILVPTSSLSPWTWSRVRSNDGATQLEILSRWEPQEPSSDWRSWRQRKDLAQVGRPMSCSPTSSS